MNIWYLIDKNCLQRYSFPELRERSYVIRFFWKKLSCHGLENGLCVTAANLMRLFRPDLSVCQFLRNHLCQIALAFDYMQQHPEHIQDSRTLSGKTGSFYCPD